MNSVKISKYLLIKNFFFFVEAIDITCHCIEKWSESIAMVILPCILVYLLCHIFNQKKSIFRSTEENLRYSLSILCPGLKNFSSRTMLNYRIINNILTILKIYFCFFFFIKKSILKVIDLSFTQRAAYD